MTAPGLSVIIFAFNEEANIAPVLTELRQWLSANEPSAEIVFVDDGSSDGTSAEAANALSGTPHQLLRHETNRGIGAALKTGVRAAKGAWVTFLPADGQIAPAAIGTLRAAAAQERAEVVFSVYDHRDDGLHRKVLSAGVRALIWMIHGVRMQSDGPYLFRHLHFDPDQLIPDTFFLNFEFPIRVLGADIPATVVTIECRPRRSGHSKSTGLKRIYGVAQDLLELRVRRARELRASRA
ncbi:MAG: glycosyltransferase family 2 protein [Deltaproteobacteria bacterium]|nr:glycosyltransferase family 2 protein [Deltaproteobacteria bacterium]MBW1875284.1 glycosyltransferase family 2 protein [Deltaproteobacteria bacterium]MBW2211578.1 glycosyltransferase family 2 protein [Deltaproteobacteria bacterium]MBW2213626.1 glycosyltransferase family 2 protein [Deltaproteobacteria bacterium]MBW2550258.1 glycosyltransferase family 2 protein [Deltaproteobacteria bacterium]